MKLEPGSTVLVLTGAGISVASGIRPFRGEGGWWTNDPEAERLATSPLLLEQPRLIWEVYGPLRPAMRRAQPNAAHLALARLQKDSGCDVRLVTQNVDGLHQRAGFEGVIELHGNLLRSRCSVCDLPAFEDPEDGPGPCPVCGELLRPDIVLFGEQIPEAAGEAAFSAVLRCDDFLAVGTSGLVFPAAMLVQSAFGYGATTTLVNLEPVDPPSPFFQREVLGRAEEVLPRLFGHA
jgi:NAD-dependent deacetylase